MRNNEYPHGIVIAVHPYPRYLNSDWILHTYISEHKEPFRWKKKVDFFEPFDYGLVFSTYQEPKRRCHATPRFSGFTPSLSAAISAS